MTFESEEQTEGLRKNKSEAEQVFAKTQELAALSDELQVAQTRIDVQKDQLTLSASLLEKEQVKFANFFNLAPVAYFVLNQTGKIDEVNLQGLSLLGLPKKEILEHQFQQFIKEDYQHAFNKFQQTLTPNKGKHSLELILLSNHGQEIYARIEGTAILNNTSTVVQYYIAIIDITRSKLIAQAAEQLEEEKQKLILSTSFNAQEKERAKISSVLHDSINQLLYGIRLHLNHLQLQHKGIEFTAIQQLLAQSIKEVRELSYQLTPSVLRDFGFVAGVKEMTKRLCTAHLKIAVQIDDATDRLDGELQLSIFRIIQELLNNCIKHAEASKIDVQVKKEDNALCLRVRDNGIGLTHQMKTALLKGSGLRGIRNRVQLLDGKFILKKPDKGTDIWVKIPIENLD